MTGARLGLAELGCVDLDHLDVVARAPDRQLEQREVEGVDPADLAAGGVGGWGSRSSSGALERRSRTGRCRPSRAGRSP